MSVEAWPVVFTTVPLATSADIGHTVGITMLGTGEGKPMPARKFAISFTPELYDAISQDVEDEGISSWLADAARAKLRYKAAQEALYAYEAEHGEITEAEVNAVEEAWLKE